MDVNVESTEVAQSQLSASGTVPRNKERQLASSPAWWIITGCLYPVMIRVMKLVDIAIAKLQGRQLQLAMQQQIVAGLSNDLCKLGSVQGPLTDLEMEISLQPEGSELPFFGSNVPDEVDPNGLHEYSVWKGNLL